MLATIVVLAAVGVFGESRETASGRSDTLALSAEYPTRFRYKQIEPLQVLVTNRSGRRLDTLTVSFDTAYVARFSDAVFTPSPSSAWDVELANVEAGETQGAAPLPSSIPPSQRLGRV